MSVMAVLYVSNCVSYQYEALINLETHATCERLCDDPIDFTGICDELYSEH